MVMRFSGSGLALAGLVFLVVGPALAPAQATQRQRTLDWGDDSTDLSVEWLVAGLASGAVSVTPTCQPVHGELAALDDNHFRYTPDEGFWSMGLDSACFSLVALDPGAEEVPHSVSVRFLSIGSNQDIWQQGFEEGEPQDYVLQQSGGGYVAVDPAAAIVGDFGLQAEVLGPSPDSAYLEWQFPFPGESPNTMKHRGGGDPHPVPDFNIELAGDTDPPGGGLTMPGGGKGGAVLEPALAAEVVVAAFGSTASGSGAEARVLMRRDLNGRVLFRGEAFDDASGRYDSTATIPTSDPQFALSVDWWREGSLRSGGLRLRVNGLSQGLNGVSNGNADMTLVRLGPQSPDAGDTPASRLALDAIRIRGLVRSLPALSAPLITDDFEDATQGGWESSFGSSATVDPGAALCGGFGLKLGFDTLGSHFLARDVLPAASTLNLRLRFDASELSLAAGELLPLFVAGERIAATPIDDVASRVRLVLGCQETAPGTCALQVALGALEVGGVVWTPWIPLGKAGVVEFQWRAAVGPEAGNGYARLWLGGEARAEIVGLSNGGQIVDRVRLGPGKTGGGIAGALKVDDITIWR